MTSLSLNSIRYAPFGSSTDHGPTFSIAKLTALLLLSNARKLVKHCLTRSTTKARPTVAAGAQTAAKDHKQQQQQHKQQQQQHKQQQQQLKQQQKQHKQQQQQQHSSRSIQLR